ncbi:unnamed protein product [Dibothriocephalus latus]|uniref:Uncharacterized protein n=1 Tax=Dibothriocephalus latus TaxID=60516 RepID=A0A3P7LAR4_DIBLA|nr:unnamed protein product [Dibothriocephalus latus]
MGLLLDRECKRRRILPGPRCCRCKSWLGSTGSQSSRTRGHHDIVHLFGGLHPIPDCCFGCKESDRVRTAAVWKKGCQ